MDGPLLSVREFQETWSALLEPLPEAGDDGTGRQPAPVVDISTDDVCGLTTLDRTKALLNANAKLIPPEPKKRKGKRRYKRTVGARARELAATMPTAEQLARSVNLASVRERAAVPSVSLPMMVNFSTMWYQEMHYGSHDYEGTLGPREVMVTVAVHEAQTNRYGASFLFPASLPLTCLMNCVSCRMDRIPKQSERPSRALFIEGVWYTDSPPGVRTLAAPILEWVHSDPTSGRHNDPVLGPMSEASAADTTLLDLSIRLATPYLAVHHGDCKHEIVFTDMRMVHGSDICDRRYYPLQIFKSPVRPEKCAFCLSRNATYVAYNDPLAYLSPVVFCDKCFVRFHASEDGGMLYANFDAFPLYSDYP